MNYSYFDLEKNNYLSPDNKIFVYEPPETLTTIAIFISSVILSIGGFISMVCKIKEKKDNIINKV
jgi:hypothetical protein